MFSNYEESVPANGSKSGQYKLSWLTLQKGTYLIGQIGIGWIGGGTTATPTIILLDDDISNIIHMATARIVTIDKETTIVQRPTTTNTVQWDNVGLYALKLK